MFTAAWAVDPVVMTVRLDLTVFPPGVRLVGAKVQVAFAGKVPHVRRTALEKTLIRPLQLYRQQILPRHHQQKVKKQAAAE